MIWLSLAMANNGVLEDERFRFCHQNGDFVFNAAYCHLAEHLPPERCPGFQEFCSAPELAPAVGCESGPGSGGRSNLPSSLIEDPDLDWNPLGMDQTAMDGFGALASGSLAMLVALTILLLALVILRFVGVKRPVAPERVARAEEDDEQSFAEAVDDVPDLPSRDLLAAARSALGEGQLGQASLLARGAVLRDLGDRRVLKLHRARTDREYIRQAEGEQAGLLRGVLEIAEQHRWGRVPLTAEHVERALAMAARLLVCLMVGLTTPAWGFDRYGPAGDAGLRALLEDAGLEVRYRSERFTSLSPDDDLDLLVIDQSGIAPRPEDWEAIEAWVRAGGVLWVTGAPPFGDFGHREPMISTQVESSLGKPRFGPMAHAFRDGEFVVSGGELAPVSARWLDAGLVVAMADRTQLWNGFLVDPQNEAFLSALVLNPEWPTVYVAELGTLGGQEPPTPPGALANMRLVPFVLQVLLLWLVTAFWKGLPFRRNREQAGEDRSGFGAHLEAVASHYRRLDARDHVDAAYDTWKEDEK